MSLNQATKERKDPDQPCFTKKEVRDIIFERNELKTNLFLVQEELSYYQRWTCRPQKLHQIHLPLENDPSVCLCREILNEERCPGFLLEAVRSAIKKRRRVIKAKMLGIPVNDCSSRSARHTLHTHHTPIYDPPLKNSGKSEKTDPVVFIKILGLKIKVPSGEGARD